MIARRRMAGRRVARAAVGTAVVVGTAGAVSHHQQQKYAQQDYQDQPVYEEQAAPPAQPQVVYVQAPPAEPAAAPAIAGPDLTAQLQQLADLHTSGAISDEEFAAAKQKLLAG